MPGFHLRPPFCPSSSIFWFAATRSQALVRPEELGNIPVFPRPGHCFSSASAMTRLRVAVVAPSLDSLGGQAVQADRLLDAWRGDPDVEAWLIPINPPPPQLLR